MEEPQIVDLIEPHLHVSKRAEGVYVAVPHLPSAMSESERDVQLSVFVDELVHEYIRGTYIAWYYTPMALKFTRHIRPQAIIYDCMDELSQFKSAPPELCVLEDELFRHADVVFTGGLSLYEHKRTKHRNIHPFPSSVDVEHFSKARKAQGDPHDQAHISRPRIGFTGVIDERFDVGLISGIAQMKPDWHLIMIGPVVKIDPAVLPRAPNIHYLGAKSYDELPRYLSGWDIAILPFARNDATRFISPTKTPEYLAAGRRVVSTSIRDVVRVYGDSALVKIADVPGECVAAIEEMMNESSTRAEWLARVDDFLARMSWDETFNAMWRLVEVAVEQRQVRPRAKVRSRVVTPATAPAPATATALAIRGMPAAPSG